MKKLFLLLLGLMAAASAHALVPADPTNLTWYDCGDESGHSYLTFTLPTVDVNGTPLDIEMMGYRIYTDDDQIFTFNSALYENIFGSSTEVYYYSWEAGSDLQSNGVFFYRTNADGFERFFNTRIGVQVFYVNDNFSIGGVSNIVYTYLEDPVADLPKPANPILEEWIDYAGGFSYLGVYFNMDFDGNDWVPLAVDGTYLDPEKLTYSIYTDEDQLFVFTPEDYPYDFTEPVTEIPYGYEGMEFGMWEVHFPNHSNETVGMERFFDWRIGMRLNYRDGDQVSNSDLVYMEIYPQLKEAAQVTSTSFFADWSCEAENTYLINNFIGEGCGYFLYVVNKETQEVVMTQNVEPTNTYIDENGYERPLPGATYMVEGLTPGTTYQFYVVVKQNTSKSYQSVVREVTLPAEGHGYDLGDVNHDHKVAINDVTFLIDYLLGTDNGACPICANVNGDNGITIADVTALIDILLSGN
ncbi:MAG: hypothetical protein IJM58_11080 [Muribaculaceae bacterium]|nr:hypothetical protein [Muribaculaceae bacterium]